MVAKDSYEPALRAVEAVHDPVPGVAVWAPDGSGTVELARLAGPARGLIMAPAHLLEAGAGSPVWDLDLDATKVRLYRLCLTKGGPFDHYRFINLAELLRLWGALELPASITETWDRAFAQAGLASLVQHRTAGAPSRPRCLAG